MKSYRYQQQLGTFFMLYRKIYFIPILAYFWKIYKIENVLSKQCVNKLVNGKENVIECKIILKNAAKLKDNFCLSLTSPVLFPNDSQKKQIPEAAYFLHQREFLARKSRLHLVSTRCEEGGKEGRKQRKNKGTALVYAPRDGSLTNTQRENKGSSTRHVKMGKL